MGREVTTAIGTPNIALVKYWGKRNEDLNLPMNSSISITLDETLNTKTSIQFSSEFESDALYINLKEQDLSDAKNEKSLLTQKIINELRKEAKIDEHALIVSTNNFPTAAGFASSASGAATLAFAAAKALDAELNLDMTEISVLARKISGSACRSLFGGFVKWEMGSNKDGLDSYAEQIADQNYWPEVIDVLFPIRKEQKKVSSSAGHKQTVRTSALYKARPDAAGAHISMIEDAIANKDFAMLAEYTMRDSNSMHATMLDTWPPIRYLNSASLAAIEAVEELNQDKGIVAGYTFDAGPNPQIITRKKDQQLVIDRVGEALGDWLRKEDIIVAGQGSGPRLLQNESLIN